MTSVPPEFAGSGVAASSGKSWCDPLVDYGRKARRRIAKILGRALQRLGVFQNVTHQRGWQRLSWGFGRTDDHKSSIGGSCAQRWNRSDIISPSCHSRKYGAKSIPYRRARGSTLGQRCAGPHSRGSVCFIRRVSPLLSLASTGIACVRSGRRGATLPTPMLASAFTHVATGSRPSATG